MKKVVYLICSIVLLSSCFKEEDPRTSFSSYDTIEIGNDYNNQVFYSLYDTSIISTNDYLEWNLAFYCDQELSYVKLNSAANMVAYKTNSTDFNADFNTNFSEEDKRFDGSFYIENQLAIDQKITGNSFNDTLFTDQEVYILYPGIEANGNEIGSYKKFVFIGVFEDAYIIKYANLDGSDQHIASIPKDYSLNYVSYSWDSHSIVDIEPDKNTWDLLFSRFTDTVYTTSGDDYLTGYAVTGLYLNQGASNVSAYFTEDYTYEEFSTENIDESQFSTKLNAIGHTWKQFSTQYNILQSRVYIVKDRNGNIFKMRFLSFYDSNSGLKGYPSFELELL